MKGNRRTVKKVIQSSVSKMGFISMKQPLPAREVAQIDPFLLLHHHGPHVVKQNNEGLPFGPHPHRGFETVTFIFEGDVKHKDSNGFESVIKSGGVQWMTAGKGIVHSERSSEDFIKDGGPFEIMQIWINLPAKQKMADPHYEGLQKSDIPEIKRDNGKVTVNLVSGKWDGHEAPQRGLYPIDLVSVSMDGGARISQSIETEKNILFYVMEGIMKVNGKDVADHQMVLFENDGELIEIEAINKCRFIIGAALPIGEPVVSRGPFVMNSEEELLQAIKDYQQGKMGFLHE